MEISAAPWPMWLGKDFTLLPLNLAEICKNKLGRIYLYLFKSCSAVVLFFTFF